MQGETSKRYDWYFVVNVRIFIYLRSTYYWIEMWRKEFWVFFIRISKLTKNVEIIWINFILFRSIIYWNIWINYVKFLVVKLVIKRHILINDKYFISYIDNEIKLTILTEPRRNVPVFNKWSEVNKTKKVFAILTLFTKWILSK